MAITNLYDQLRRDEANELEAYPDPDSPLGRACQNRKLPMREYRQIQGWENMVGAPWTIGNGHTGPEVHQGLVWDQAQVDDTLVLDVAKHDAALYAGAPWARQMDDARRGVLRNMCFNLGGVRFFGFKHMLAAAQAGDWNICAAEMMNSAWATQIGDRAKRLEIQMRIGEWQ